MDNNSISVVIPTFNEEKRISKTLESINRYSLKTNLIKEVILVDDGSRDNTVSVVANMPNIQFPLRILKNQKNMGKGFSVKRGMLEATGDAILFMDADGSVSIENLDKFTKEMKNADVVIASIEVGGAKVVRDDNFFMRRFLGKMAKWLIKVVVLPGIYDSQRGFKLFSKKARDIIFPKQTINRWGFDIEILLIAKKTGFKIEELPIIWDNPRSDSVKIRSYLVSLYELFLIKINDLYGIYKNARKN